MVALFWFAEMAAAGPIAVPVAWTVDPARSVVSLAVTVAIPEAPSLQPQGPGSLSAALAGVVSGTLYFQDGEPFGIETTTSTASFLESGSWSPGPFGLPGSAPAAFAGLLDLSPLGVVTAAARDFQVAEVVLPFAPLIAMGPDSWAFDDAIQLRTRYRLDFSATEPLGSLLGAPRGNEINDRLTLNAGTSSIERIGAQLEWTVPVDVLTGLDVHGTPLSLNMRFTGQIVLTTAVPEAGSSGLLAAAAGFVTLVCARRRLAMNAQPCVDAATNLACDPQVMPRSTVHRRSPTLKITH